MRWPEKEECEREEEKSAVVVKLEGGVGGGGADGTSMSHLLFINFTSWPINTKKGELQVPDLLFGFEKIYTQRICRVIIVILLFLII